MASNKRKPTIDELKGLPPDPNTKSGIPNYVIESIARTILPDIIAFYESEEGRKEYDAWKREQERMKQRDKE